MGRLSDWLFGGDAVAKVSPIQGHPVHEGAPVSPATSDRAAHRHANRLARLYRAMDRASGTDRREQLALEVRRLSAALVASGLEPGDDLDGAERLLRSLEG